MSQRPDFLNGRGIGWAAPFASIVRQRKVYSPAGNPGRSAAQCAFASRIGHDFGLPAASKPIVSFGMVSPARFPPHFAGGVRIRASVHGAVVKYGSSAGQPLPSGDTHTCTLDNPETPTCA